MKYLKKLFIIGILLMGLLTGLVFFSTTDIAMLMEDGLAVPESSGILQSLRSG